MKTKEYKNEEKRKKECPWKQAIRTMRIDMKA
jgi:hypothetical protein